MTRSDFPMSRRWLAETPVAAVREDPDEEIALTGREVEGGDSGMPVVHTGMPIGYIQNWNASREARFRNLPKGARAVDTLPGEPSFPGRGQAKACVRRYARTLVAERAPVVATDPRFINPRGIDIRLAAGFRKGSVARCETGEDIRILTCHAPS